MNIFHSPVIDGSWMLHFVNNSRFLSFYYIFGSAHRTSINILSFFLIISYLPIACMQICFIHS